MYYQNYEDYMRSVLGYPVNSQDTYQMNYYNENRNNNYEKELEDLYPDVYKTINPFVIDVCSRCNGSVTRDSLEDMIEEVYSKIENNEINIDINVINNSDITSTSNSAREAENRSVTQNASRASYNRNSMQNISNETLKRSSDASDIRETRQRRPNNPFLRDLIKILILDRLLGQFSNRPGRPYPPRPPYPGIPGGQDLGRPPMPPRPGPRGEFDDYLRF